MLPVTLPVAVESDHVWLLVSAPTGAVEAARLAYAPRTQGFLALPCEAFDTTAVLPITAATAEPLDGFQWATVGDVERHADLFTTNGVRW